MKKKSTSQSAPARRSLGEGGFFNLRVLIGAFVCLGAVAVAPTSTLAQCSWSAGPILPNPPGTLVRAVGVYFPADGNFYSVGGRTSDLAGSDFQHVLRYSPGTNTWTQTGVTLPDNNMNNMACGVLTVSGTPYIYCVGGSFATGTTATARVFFYDPATDTSTTLSSGDNWPGDAAGTILPGGFTVANNKLYILGGFNINVASTNQIWQFDPTAAVGSKWTQMVNTPEGVMYAPTCTIGNIIYLGGASDFSGGTVIDTTNSFSFDPATNTIGSIAPIPRATGETRGLNFCNNMYVMGGGRVAPNPSNEVDIYDPVSNSWTTGQPFVNARRNFPTDTDGTTNIWLAGGYEPATPAGDMEIFHCPASPCASPTPTPTATATATFTPTPTPTPTPVQITLHARGYKVHGLQKVDLFWSGLSSGFIDIYRDGVLVATVAAQGGFYTDNIDRTGKGTYVYRACVAGTGNCSNQVTVKFGSG
jgi:hypothetical protein